MLLGVCWAGEGAIRSCIKPTPPRGVLRNARGFRCLQCQGGSEQGSSGHTGKQSQAPRLA